MIVIPIKNIIPGDVIAFSNSLPMLCLSVVFDSELPKHNITIGLLSKEGHLSFTTWQYLERMIHLYFRDVS